VIVAQAALTSAQRAAVKFRMQRTVASVQLFTAMGGGWNASKIPSPKELAAKTATVKGQ